MRARAPVPGQQLPQRATMLALQPLMLAAERFEKAGELPRAIDKYREALHVWPDFDMAHYNLALSLQESGRAAEAHAHFRRTLELLPPSPPPPAQDDARRFDVLSHLGQLSAQMALALAAPAGGRIGAGASQLREAGRQLRAALAMQPTHVGCREALGKVRSCSARGARAAVRRC
jgi:tetratricopeptide (TPR) repeat protein